MALDLEHLRLQARVALKHPELSGWADAVLELIHELTALRAQHERLRGLLADTLVSLRHARCTCRHCEPLMLTIREALSTPGEEQNKDAFADLPRLPSVEIPTIGTLGAHPGERHGSDGA